MKDIIATKEAPAAIGPYSQAVKAGNTLYMSGQLGINPATGELAEGGVKGQALQALANMKAVLEAAGATADNVVKTVVFITDMKDFPVVNEAYQTLFTKDFPARSCVAVAALPKGGLVEIEAVAVL